MKIIELTRSHLEKVIQGELLMTPVIFYGEFGRFSGGNNHIICLKIIDSENELKFNEVFDDMMKCYYEYMEDKTVKYFKEKGFDCKGIKITASFDDFRLVDNSEINALEEKESKKSR